MLELDNHINRLIRNAADFVVVGDFAAFAYGARNVSGALEVCCDFSVENLLRVQAALSDLHPVHRMLPARPRLELTPESCEGLENVYLDTEYGPLDCVSSVMGAGNLDEVKRNSVEIQLEAGACRVLSLDALIRSKEAMGRPRDREAVLQLKAIRERLAQQ